MPVLGESLEVGLLGGGYPVVKEWNVEDFVLRWGAL